eukprot:2679939-Rhodomonas_salina.1
MPRSYGFGRGGGRGAVWSRGGRRPFRAAPAHPSLTPCLRRVPAKDHALSFCELERFSVMTTKTWWRAARMRLTTALHRRLLPHCVLRADALLQVWPQQRHTPSARTERQRGSADPQDVPPRVQGQVSRAANALPSRAQHPARSWRRAL